MKPMKKIEFYPGINLDKAYQELQDNAPCYGEFNEKTLYSTDSLDEVFVKVTGKSKAEHDEYIRKMHTKSMIVRKRSSKLKFLN